MAIKEIWRSKRYDPAKVETRYVRQTVFGDYRWCETYVDKAGRRFDIRQGLCTRDDLPTEVATAAHEVKGTYPGNVVWPLV